MQIQKFMQVVKDLQHMDSIKLSQVVRQIKLSLESYLADYSKLGHALYKLCQQVMRIKDVKDDTVAMFEELICAVIRISIQADFRVGFDAMRYVFNLNSEFYKTANLDLGLVYPIGKDHPLKQYIPQIGQQCDTVRPYITSTSFCGWTRCIVLDIQTNKYTIKYGNSTNPNTSREKPWFAPLGERTKDYEWRMSLNIGSPVEALLNRVWYKATIAEVGEENGCKKVRVTFRRFDQNGDRQDSIGNRYFGLGIGEDQWMDVTSSRIQQCGKMAFTKLCYYTVTSEQILLDDSYDIIFEDEYNKSPFYSIMRIINCKSLSLIKFINTFISLKGLQKTLSIVDNPQINNDITYQILANIGVMVPFMPRMFVQNNPLLKTLYSKIFDYFVATAKNLNVYKLDMGYFCYDMIGRRILSLSEVHADQNQLRKALAREFLKMNMEKQMLALRYLNDLIHPKKPYTQSERDSFNKFLKDEKIFDQIYNSNTHQQIFSRSVTLLQYLIQNEIISISEFESLWKIFSISDTRGRSIIQKLLAQTSKNIPIAYIQLLIQKILSLKETELTMDNLNLLKELKNRNIDNQSQNKILSFLWDLLTVKSANVKDNIEEEVEKVFKAFVSTIKDPKVRMNLLESMGQKLQDCKRVKNQIQLLKDFVKSYPQVYSKAQGQEQQPDYVPMTIYEAVNFLKSKGIYPGLLNLLSRSKDQSVKKDILELFKFLFENDTNDVNEIVQQLYKIMGPSPVFLQWTHKILHRSITFITDLLQTTTDFSAFQNLPSKGFEALQSMMMDINVSKKNMRIHKTYTYKSKGLTQTTLAPKDPTELKKEQEKQGGIQTQVNILFYVLVSPFKLIGMKFFENLLQVAKESKVYGAIVKFIIQLISNLDSTIEFKTEDFRRQFLDQIVREIKLIEQQKEPDAKSRSKLQVFINLFQQIFSQTEKEGLSDIKPHFEKVEGETLSLSIQNLLDKQPTKKYQAHLPKFSIVCNENETLWNFKKRVGEIINEGPQQIDIIKYSDPMVDTVNGKSLSQLIFYDNECIKVDRKKRKSIIKQNLLNADNTDISPKLQIIVRYFFDKYKNQENDGLTMQQLEKLANEKWRSTFYKQKVNLLKLFEDHDKDKKGYLTYNDFKDFFFVSSSKSSAGIWRLLCLSGFKNDLKPSPSVKDFPIVEQQKLSTQKVVRASSLPRRILSNPELYNLIFSLLKNQGFSSQHPALYSLLCSIETAKDLLQITKTTKTFLQAVSTYANSGQFYHLCYTLQIFNSELTKKSDVYFQFWENGGIQALIECLRNICKDKLIYQFDSIVKSVLYPSVLKIFNIYVREILSDSQLVRFISAFKINQMEPKDFVKKVDELKIQKEVPELTATGKKLRQFEGYQLILQKLYELSQFTLQNLMKNYASEKAQYLQKLTVQVVRLTSCLVSSTQNHHKFHPSCFLHAITNGSLNYRRSAIIIIYIYLFYSKSKNSAEIQKIIEQIRQSMPKQNKFENQEYFIILSQLVSRYLAMDSNGERHQYFVDFGNRLLDTLFQELEGESRMAYSADKIIAGILSVFAVIIKKDSVCLALAKRKAEITQKCLFAYKIEQKVEQLEVTSQMLIQKNQGLHFKGYVLCKTQDSREHTYRIITRLHQMTPDDDYLNTHILPIIKSIKDDVRLTAQKTMAVGLKNFGSTCYMNSMLQVLNSLSPFRNCLIKCNSQSPVIKQLKKVFAALYFSERVDYAPSELLKSFVPPINPSIQQDTTEFLNFLFDQLQGGLANTREKKLLDEMFKGANVVQMICHSCGYKKQNREEFFCFGVQIEGKVDLQSALQGSHQGQIISDYLCDECKNKGETTKRNLLSQIPSVLFIHLRRIVFNYDMFVNMKIHTRLQFPQQLNIEPFTKQGVQLRQTLGLQYMKKLAHNEEQSQKFKKMAEHGKEKDFYKLKLKGVIVHSGSADVGHYYSILEAEKMWRKYDDSRIGIFTSSEFENYCYGGNFVADQWGAGTSANAYVLVYQKIIKNQLQFFPQGKQKQVVKYDDVKVYNSPQDYKTFWLDNHYFMLQTQLLDPKVGKDFIKFMCRLLQTSKTCKNKPQIISQCLYRIIIHSSYLSDFLKLTIDNSSSFTPSILYQFVLQDKLRTFKLLTNYQRPIRDFMATYLHIVLLQSYKKGDDKVKLDVLSYISELINALPTDFAKSWMRIDGFFKLIFNLITSAIQFEEMWAYFVAKNLISMFIDFVMQKQSPVKINPKNYSLGTKTNPLQFSYAIATISFLVKHSYSFTGKNYEIQKIPEHYLFHLNNNDVSCLSHMDFYRKMFAQRQNLYQLASIIHRLCIQNLPFSTAIIQVLLESINSITDSKDQMFDYSHICLEILRIKDQFWVRRAEMLLGVGLPSVLNQNLMTTFDQQRFAFTSTIFDIFPVQCLFSYSYLYRLKNTLACFQLIRATIQGCSISPTSMLYLARQPSPTYIFPSLLAWMQNFIQTFMSLLQVQKKQKQRLQQQISNTLKYVEDIKKQVLQHPEIKLYRSVITGEIVEKNQKAVINKDGIEVKVYECLVYCCQSKPSAVGGNPGFEGFVDEWKKANSVDPKSDIFKFMKKPGKAFALKVAPVEQNEDKQLISLFDDDPYPKINNSQTKPQTDQPQTQQKQTKKSDIKLTKQQMQQIPAQEESSLISPQQSPTPTVISIPTTHTSAYLRQIQLTNTTKDKKVVQIIFKNLTQNGNTIIPHQFSWKIFAKSNQSLWLAKQVEEADSDAVEMDIRVVDFVKEIHDKKSINKWWFKLYQNEQMKREDKENEKVEQIQVEKVKQKDQPQSQTQAPASNQVSMQQATIIECPVCTYINIITRQNCDMCDSALF